MLKELNKLYLAGTFTSNKFKKFQVCQQFHLDDILNFNQAIIPIFENFWTNNSDNNFYNTLNNCFDSQL